MFLDLVIPMVLSNGCLCWKQPRLLRILDDFAHVARIHEWCSLYDDEVYLPIDWFFFYKILVIRNDCDAIVFNFIVTGFVVSVINIMPFRILSIWLTCLSTVDDAPTVAASDVISSTLLTLGFGFKGLFGLRQTFAKLLLLPQFL